MKEYEVVLRLSGRYTVTVEMPDGFDEADGFADVIEAVEAIADGEDFGALEDIDLERITVRDAHGSMRATGKPGVLAIIDG